jgi:hypothetical protein
VTKAEGLTFAGNSRVNIVCLGQSVFSDPGHPILVGQADGEKGASQPQNSALLNGGWVKTGDSSFDVLTAFGLAYYPPGKNAI